VEGMSVTGGTKLGPTEQPSREVKNNIIIERQLKFFIFKNM
jgi:hypothetical protein